MSEQKRQKRRDKWLHVKLTEEERQQWQQAAEAEGVTVADLIRLRMGSATEGRRPRQRRASRRADPALLAALGKVGSNLNQIARWANTHKSAADAVQVVAALAAVERILLSYRPSRDSGADAGGGDDADQGL